MKLIGSPTSPYVRKVRVVLAEKKIDCDFVIENVWVPETTIDQVNPLGKVPTLVLDDGFSVYDSRVIVEYLDSRAPTNRLIPDSGRDRTEVKIWEALCDGLQDAAILMLHENKRPEKQRSPEWLTRQAHKVDQALAAMAHQLGKNPWCFGKGFSLADVSVGVALGYMAFRYPDNRWQSKYPNLLAHFNKLSERASFQATVPKDPA